MNNLDEYKSDHEFEVKVRSAFQIQDPEQLFIDRLEKKLVERIEVVGHSKASEHSSWLDKVKLTLPSLAWGAIGLILIVALVWGIKTLIPRNEPIIGSQSTPTPGVTPLTSLEPTQAGEVEPADMPQLGVGMPEAWPVTVITRENAYKVTQLGTWGRGMINAITWSPDAKAIAIASSTGIYLYDAVTYEEIDSIAIGSNISQIEYSPDGATLATHQGYSIKLWDVASGKEVQTISTQSPGWFALAFSPNGYHLAFSSDDSTIKIWDIKRGNELHTIEEPTKFVTKLVFSSDGATLVSLFYSQAGGLSIVKLYDVSSGTEIIPQRSCRGYDMAVSTENHALAVRHVNSIAICDLESGELIHEQRVGPGELINYSPDGEILAGTAGGEIKLWDTASWDEILTLNSPVEWFMDMAFSPDGSKLIASSFGFATIWELVGGQELYTITGFSTPDNAETMSPLEAFGERVVGQAISPDGKMFATAGEEGPLLLYDLATGELLAEFETEVGSIYGLTFNTDSNLIAVGGGHGGATGVQIWDVATHEQRLKLGDFSEIVYSLAFSPDGRTLATGEGFIGGSAKLWDLETGELLSQFGKPDQWNEGSYVGAHDVEFSPDGSILAIGSEDGSVMLWDVVKRTAVTVLQGSSAEIKYIAFSPDGTLLAASSYADNPGEKSDMRVWDVETGKTLFILQYSPGAIAFNADGQVLASTSNNGDVLLWDVGTGHQVANLVNGFMNNVVFSPDGTLLVSGGDIVRLWGIELQESLRSEASPTLAADELQR